MKKHQGTVWSGPAATADKTIEALCEAAGLWNILADQQQVILKPNLIEALPPPITTPVELVTVIADCIIRHCPHIKIIIGEGTGSLEYDTFYCFEKLGYLPLGQKNNIALTDLNVAPLRHLQDHACSRWPEMYLPELLFSSYLISIPVLKAHSLAKVTLTMKNMMGCAPPAHYKGSGGWGKAAFHRHIHEAVYELNRYRKPDFTIMDASIGMAQAHLWGPTCNPPVGKIAAAFDPVAIDAYGSSLLNRSWQDIAHIKMAHQVLGSGDPITLIEPANT